MPLFLLPETVAKREDKWYDRGQNAEFSVKWERIRTKLKKKTLVVLLILLAVLIPLVWLLSTYHVVDSVLYARDTTQLDLRGQSVSVAHYEKLRTKLPEADIRWDVPFQGEILAEETAEVTVTELTVEDADILARYLPRLRTVNAEDCRDYEALLSLKQMRPGVKV